MSWHPHVTVAAVAEQAGRFLLVEEQTRYGLAWNQPAGHWEPGESLIDAVVRETREETAYTFHPTALIGVYVWARPTDHDDPAPPTFLRVTFTGTVDPEPADQALDEGIVRAFWAEPETLRSAAAPLRSPMVLRSVDDWMAGVRHPLDLIQHLAP
ncbi:MAG: NUDIX hydrolase [Abyssibacter sp.]|nr:NUDIX hydrolase [Abyssibacter sp.]MCK5860278.1 NUDIX hydrolase [Abyssibacter sp.]